LTKEKYKQQIKNSLPSSQSLNKSQTIDQTTTSYFCCLVEAFTHHIASNSYMTPYPVKHIIQIMTTTPTKAK